MAQLLPKVSIYHMLTFTNYSRSALTQKSASKQAAEKRTFLTLGVLRGEGIGPEVIDATLRVLQAIESCSGELRFRLRFGGEIGEAAIQDCGQPLSPQVCEFCAEIFADSGAVLAGPGGNRFVYQARRQFALFYKLNPLVPATVPLRASRMRPEYTKNVDILVLRENLGGVYQGTWEEKTSTGTGRMAAQRFWYSEEQIRSILLVAVDFALKRRGELTVVVKPNGVPTISALWVECARELASQYALKLQVLEIDYATFSLIQEPQQFDVVVTPNLFGDILADVGGVLLGSRGLCYGGSFSATNAAIYQTNHGAAYDLAGTDRANPVGQMYSLAMLLRESFGLQREANLIHTAVTWVWQSGIRTDDLAEPGCRSVGTREMGELVADAVRKLSLDGA